MTSFLDNYKTEFYNKYNKNLEIKYIDKLIDIGKLIDKAIFFHIHDDYWAYKIGAYINHNIRDIFSDITDKNVINNVILLGKYFHESSYATENKPSNLNKIIDYFESIKIDGLTMIAKAYVKTLQGAMND